ncbi:MAG TPA: SDR family oxidoreductase [Firmicutes bacterium]|nr:SDR family oxidoreductase [Bacillota bacterium]
MDYGLKGRVALVTGASRGIGKATALCLAHEGACVAVGYRENAAAAEDVVSQITAAGGKAVAVAGDLSNTAEIRELVAQVQNTLGGIDILVSNAGIWPTSRISEISDEAWQQSLAVNLTATFALIREVLPSMRRKRHGRIVAVSSQAAARGSVSGHAHYAAAKAGLVGLIRSVAREEAELGITANIVAPGIVATDMSASAPAGRQQEWLQEIPVRRFAAPEEVAALIAFLCSAQAGYITGAVVPINGGQHMG